MSQDEKSKVLKENQAVSTVRSTVGPTRWSSDHMETYAEVLKYGKVKKKPTHTSIRGKKVKILM